MHSTIRGLAMSVLAATSLTAGALATTAHAAPAEEQALTAPRLCVSSEINENTARECHIYRAQSAAARAHQLAATSQTSATQSTVMAADTAVRDAEAAMTPAKAAEAAARASQAAADTLDVATANQPTNKPAAGLTDQERASVAAVEAATFAKQAAQDHGLNLDKVSKADRAESHAFVTVMRLQQQG